NAQVLNLEAAPADMMFPNIKRLKVKSSTAATSVEWLNVAYRFPHLESLDFATRNHQPVVEELSQRAVENSWPWSRARRLRLDQSQLSSEDMSRFLGCIEAYRVWRVPYAHMSTQSFEDLSQHFGSLEELDLGVSSEVASYMIRAILEFCPRLKVLRGGRVSSLDIAHGGPWACRSLRSLKLFVDTSATSPFSPASSSSSSPTTITAPIDQGQLVLQRIGTLLYLEELDVSGLSMASQAGIEFSLKRGLGHLVGLKQLKELRFKHTKQYMESDDIAWMLNSWPELKVVEGLLNCNSAFGSSRAASRLNTMMNRRVEFINDL
ncbi:hypothetical protein BGX27_007126, partial [Mortierella sp. AM989]